MTRKWYATLCHPKMHPHTKFGIPTSKNVKRYAPDTIILKGQGQRDTKRKCTTPSSQDAFTRQIWNFYLKEYRRYAPDSMQFLETKSEVKLKVTVTQLWYSTLFHPKMHHHTKFEIPTSNNMRYVSVTIILKTRSEFKVTVTPKWYMALRHPKMHSHTKFVIPTSKSIKRYAQDTILLKTRSEVKVTVTGKWYVTLRHSKIHPHTKFGIHTSKNIRYSLDMIILKTRSEVKVTVTLKWYATLRHCKMYPHTKF